VRQLIISESDDPNALEVKKECDERRNQKVKVYSIRVELSGYIIVDSFFCTFRTTSKGLFLALGSMSPSCQIALAKAIHHEFAAGGAYPSEVSVHADGGLGTFLVTRTGLKETGDCTLTLSPAH